MAGHALPLEGPHDALRPDDLPELAVEPLILLAVGAPVIDAPGAAWAEAAT